MHTEQDYEARARQLAELATTASDAAIASAQRQLARAYKALARWHRQRERTGGEHPRGGLPRNS